jgi:flagellar protein FliL
MKKLLPVLLAVLGLGGGLAAGTLLKPAPEAPAMPGDPDYATVPDPDPTADPDPDAEKPAFDYARMDSQFVVPVMADGQVRAMVVLSISLEVAPGSANDVHARGPKLRDGFLRVLFEHERAGGFSGVFTDSRTLGDLRARLLVVAKGVLGAVVNDVLVTDILRQDV